MKTITLITNSEVLSFEDTVKLSKKLSRNGLNRIQIRERNISHTSLTNFIKKMKDSVEESCELFINGNLGLAIENNLNGVHFPEKYQINEYQNKENLILGRSIHENTDLNKHQKKFDYYHLGPIFVTQSHPNQNTIKEKNISYISRKLSNVIFVGGININNVSKLSKYNFSGIAIMRELLLSRSPEKTFMELREKINE